MRMDKEKLITIAIGLSVGIALAAIFFGANKILPIINQRRQPSTFSPDKSASPSTLAAGNLTLDNPTDNSSTTNNTVTVSGKVNQPGQKIIIFANTDEKIASADAQGNFTADIKLEEGENAISATIIDQYGNPTTIKRSVTLEISQ